MYRDLDERIIENLREDGRMSLRELSRRLDVSPTTVSQHLDALRENGIIRGFKPVLDHAKLGYGITAVIQIKAEGNLLNEIVSSLQADDRLTHVYEITGEFDLLVIGKFQDQLTMNEEIKRLLNHPGVEGTNTSITLSTVKEDDDVRLRDASDGRPSGY